MTEQAQQLKKEDLLEIAQKWQEKLKVKPKGIRVRKMKKKWGSHSSKGNVTLNSEIAKLPKEIAEYIILHELAHLIVPNHGKAFKALLSVYMPTWEKLHNRLRIHIDANDTTFSYAIQERFANLPVHIDVCNLPDESKKVCLSRVTIYLLQNKKTHKLVKRKKRVCSPICEVFSSEEVNCMNKNKGAEDFELVKQSYMCVQPRSLSSSQVIALTNLPVETIRAGVKKMRLNGELKRTGFVVGEALYTYVSTRKRTLPTKQTATFENEMWIVENRDLTPMILTDDELEALSKGMKRFGEAFADTFPKLKNLRYDFGFWWDHIFEFYNHGILQEEHINENVIEKIKPMLRVVSYAALRHQYLRLKRGAKPHWRRVELSHWKDMAVRQRNETGGVPTGYEWMIRYRDIRDIRLDTFQEDFDLELTGEDSNNFASVARKVMERYPQVSIKTRRFSEGYPKVCFVKSLLKKDIPCILSFVQIPKGRWHIVPVVYADYSKIKVIWFEDETGSQIREFNILEAEYLHGNWRGGKEIAWLQ